MSQIPLTSVPDAPIIHPINMEKTAMTEESAVDQVLKAMRDSLPSVPRWIFVNSSVNPIGFVDLGFSVGHHPALKYDEVVIEYRNGFSQFIKLDA